MESIIANDERTVNTSSHDQKEIDTTMLEASNRHLNLYDCLDSREKGDNKNETDFDGYVRDHEKHSHVPEIDAVPTCSISSNETESTSMAINRDNRQSYITLKYSSEKVPIVPSNKEVSLHRITKPESRGLPSTQMPQSFTRISNSLSPPDVQMNETAVERFERFETENRRLLFANDQYRLNVIALQAQIRDLQQKNGVLRQENHQLKHPDTKFYPFTQDILSKPAYASLDHSQQAALTALHAHQGLLLAQPSAVLSSASSSNSFATSTEIIDIKLQLANKGAAAKKLQKQNEHLKIELAKLQHDIKKMFDNNEELTKSVMRFAQLEQIGWPQERIRMNNEIVALRVRMYELNQELLRSKKDTSSMTGPVKTSQVRWLQEQTCKGEDSSNAVKEGDSSANLDESIRYDGKTL